MHIYRLSNVGIRINSCSRQSSSNDDDDENKHDGRGGGGDSEMMLGRTTQIMCLHA